LTNPHLGDDVETSGLNLMGTPIQQGCCIRASPNASTRSLKLVALESRVNRPLGAGSDHDGLQGPMQN
jgi:hypothetical protein